MDNLSKNNIAEILYHNLQGEFTNQKVLVLIPDSTRSLPLPFLFREITELLSDSKQLDFMVALGTHSPLNEDQLCQLVGITQQENANQFSKIRFFNHSWTEPAALKQIGVLSKEKIQEIAGEQWHVSMGGDVPVKINKRIYDYDHVIILGPTFPHEVVGFSGGAKYLFPGISGPEMINSTHWLGALGGVMNTIGIKDTPIRRMIHAAAEMVNVPITLIAVVVKEDEIAGVFVGDYIRAWEKAEELSSKVHVRWCEKPYHRVLSHASSIYNELWTAAKAMYKLEAVVADGGELVIYAPHMETVSHVHGEHIFEIGYHSLPYFLSQWQKFSHVPLSVLAHSTHVRGAGEYMNGIEKPRIQVTLSSQISEADCKKLNLGYLDPASIDVSDWVNVEDQGILYAPKAGEILYKLLD